MKIMMAIRMCQMNLISKPVMDLNLTLAGWTAFFIFN